MQSTDPLAQLHDIVLPQAVSWWPLAWGWWVLLVLVVGTSASLIFFWQRRKKRTHYRRAALAKLDQILQDYQREQNSARYLQQLSILLRRTAISAHSHTFPVDIKGEAWLLWLEAHCPEVNSEFSAGVGQILLTGPYQAKPQIDVSELHQLARTWLQRHRHQWQKNPVAKRSEHTQTEVNQHA